MEKIKYHFIHKVADDQDKMQVTKNQKTNTFRFSHNAMATIFEVLICHDEEKYAKQAAEQAFFELDRIEQDFSRFIENSDISRINKLSINESTRVGADTFACLLQCADLYVKTKGAFDITIGSLMK